MTATAPALSGIRRGSAPCRGGRRLCGRIQASIKRQSSGEGCPGLKLSGPCTSFRCSIEQAAASTCHHLPSAEQRQRLAQRLAGLGSAPLAATLAAAALQQPHHQPQQPQQERQAQRSSACCDKLAGGGGPGWSAAPAAQAAPAVPAPCSSPDDAVWAYGRCAAQGDAWCLLSMAQLAAESAADADVACRRRQLSATSLNLLCQAAAVVHAAPEGWDLWLRGGANAALGSFVALCSSGGSPADVACQLAAVSRLATEAVAEEGGAELWLLQDVLAQQEAQLHLVHSVAAS